MTNTFSPFAACATFLALAACAQTPKTLAIANNEHLQLRARAATAELSFPLTGGSLSPAAAARVTNFADAWRREGHGPIVISRPAGAAETDGLRSADEVRARLLAAGVPNDAVVESPLKVGDGKGGMLVSFQTYEVAPVKCPDVSATDLSLTASNGPPEFFGCAVTMNIAAMIADPSDLLGAREMGPPDTDRRVDVLTKYRKGAHTAAERNENASGKVSHAVGN